MSLHNEIDFLLKVESGKKLVDMNYTLDTMKGFSSTITAITEGALSDDFKSKSSAADDIRTELLESFLGSYVQNFRLKINNPQKELKLKKMSNSVLAELITYYVNEVLHAKQPKLSKKADYYITKLEPIENQIITRISSWVKEMHTISIRKEYAVKLYRKTDLKKFNLFEINKTTYGNAFELTDDANITNIEAVISRFNIFTGNGRLLIQGENTTTPFGFSGGYSKVKSSYKQKISQNLSQNTILPDDQRVNIPLMVKAKRNKSREIVKFIIYEV